MKLLRILLHSLALTAANFGSIILGFAIYYSLRQVNQIAVQAPIAAILSIIAFVVWSLFVHRLPFKRLYLRGTKELIWVYFVSLLWNPIIFIPLHYVTKGYLTSRSNILALWLFQLPVNLAAVLLANKLSRE